MCVRTATLRCRTMDRDSETACRPILKWSQRLMNFVEQKRPELQARAEITWTDDRVELLKRLWAEGLSASQIAGELGGITRNAVIGKVHRLGLSGRAKSPSSSVPRPRKPRAATQMFRPSRPMVRGNTALAAQPSYDYDMEPEI